MTVVLDPTMTPAPGEQVALAPRAGSLESWTLGVLDNGKPNSDRFLDALQADLVAGHGVTDDVVRRKPAIGKPVPDALRAELIESCDGVITGVGDCAGCCWASVLDGLAFEAAGRATAMVCTDEFRDTAQAAAEQGGLPSYPFAVIPHPLGSLTPPALRALARAILPEVVWALAGAHATRGPSAAPWQVQPDGVSCEC